MVCHFFHVVSFFSNRLVHGRTNELWAAEKQAHWLAVYVVPPLCGLMQNNTKCLMLGFHWALRLSVNSSAGWLRTTAPFFPWPCPMTHAPLSSPVQSLPSSSVVPSNGMIVVADIGRLSWWSCVNTERVGDGKKEKSWCEVGAYEKEI